MSLKILVVEREVHAREGLRSILSSEGHAVTVAEDIWAGFARVAVQPFDLLLLDDDVRLDRHETMIVADLLCFARRKHPGTRGIVLSSVMDDMPRYQRENGVVAVLEKPVEVPRLRHEVEALAGRVSGPGQS
jgi:DNA-binding response OmpR family regulator